MNVPFVDLKALHAPLQPNILRIIEGLLEGGVLMGGEQVKNFEEDFARYMGTRCCIACANGTDALEIILRALEIKGGDEVIVPANGWMSAAEAVLLVGATPVFVDNDPHTYTINPALIEARITKHTRAIIPIHLYGLAADLAPIIELARPRGIKIIEDAAQAHGAAMGNQKTGSMGDAAAFSFYPTKNLGALGDGGAMLTNDEALADKMRSIANHGQLVRDQPLRLGRNSRMDALQAAVLSMKLPYLDAWNRQRRQLAKHYQQQLADSPAVLPTVPDDQRHVHHLYVVRVAQRDSVQQHLAKKGIVTQVHYPYPVPALNPFRHLPSAQERFPVATRQASELLSLPLHPAMSLDTVDYVCGALKEALV